MEYQKHFLDYFMSKIDQDIHDVTVALEKSNISSSILEAINSSARECGYSFLYSLSDDSTIYLNFQIDIEKLNRKIESLFNNVQMIEQFTNEINQTN